MSNHKRPRENAPTVEEIRYLLTTNSSSHRLGLHVSKSDSHMEEHVTDSGISYRRVLSRTMIGEKCERRSLIESTFGEAFSKASDVIVISRTPCCPCDCD